MILAHPRRNSAWNGLLFVMLLGSLGANLTTYRPKDYDQGGLIERVVALEKEASQYAPVGVVMAWPSDGPLPSGAWRECDGTSVSVADVPDGRDFTTLKKALSAYQSGTDNGRVKLPNFCGCFLRGAGSTKVRSIRTDGTVTEVALAAAAIATQQEFATGAPKNCVTDNQGFFGYLGSHDNKKLESPEGNRFPAMPPLMNNGLRFDSETRPVNFSVRWIIRVRTRADV